MATLGSPTRILIACDDEATRTLARRRFTRVGFQVMEAADATQAMSLVSMIPFDLAILDLRSEDVCDLIRRIRMSRSPAELPILAVADGAVGEAGGEALNAGACDCIPRPLDF